MSAGGRASVLSGWSAARLQAGWTLRRIRRGRMLWLACLFALGPISFAFLVVAKAHHVKWDALFAPLVLLAGIVPPLLSASVIADEFEDHTYTYLWSRPLPRWSVLIGKLMATVPLAAAVLCVTAAICYQVGQRGAAPGNPWAPLTLPRGVAAMAMAALAISLASGSIAVMMPRHGLGVAYAYLLVLDAPLGAMPFSIARLSITYHVSVIGGLKQPEDGSGGASALWLCGIAGFWLALGLWRLARSEFSSDAR
ncbi:MAG TPA: ABC transporter permease [Kofleriaceae bacterium]|nr:ABC transporter permease [Kofleriaceae bacterium]